MSQYHFTPDEYEQMITDEVPAYRRLQQRVANAAREMAVPVFLDLGIGTGVTARAILDLHPDAQVVGVDISAEMLRVARSALPEGQVLLVEQGLEQPLPGGPYPLVVSVLAIHHLDAMGKADLFRRVFAVLRPGGRFVFADVVVPRQPVERLTPLTPGYDRPDTVSDQVGWLVDAGFEIARPWAEGDLAVFSAMTPLA